MKTLKELIDELSTYHSEDILKLLEETNFKDNENIEMSIGYILGYEVALKGLQNNIPDRSESLDYIDYLLTN